MAIVFSERGFDWIKLTWIGQIQISKKSWPASRGEKKYRPASRAVRAPQAVLLLPSTISSTQFA
jgi:hypothetical protein